MAASHRCRRARSASDSSSSVYVARPRRRSARAPRGTGRVVSMSSRYSSVRSRWKPSTRAASCWVSGDGDAQHLALTALRPQPGHDAGGGPARFGGGGQEADGLLQVVGAEAAQVAPRVDPEGRRPSSRRRDGDQQPVPGHPAILRARPPVLRTRRIIRFIVGATTEPARLGSAGRPAYAEPVSELWGALDTRPEGLTDEEAAARRPPETVRHERSRTLLVLERGRGVGRRAAPAAAGRRRRAVRRSSAVADAIAIFRSSDCRGGRGDLRGPREARAPRTARSERAGRSGAPRRDRADRGARRARGR